MMNNKQPPSPITTFVLVGSSLLYCLLFVAQMMLVVPAYQRQFSDFRMRLPFFTQVAFQISQFIVRFWPVVVVGIFVAMALAGWISYLIRHRSDRRWLSTVWFLLLIVIPFVANVILWLAYWLPHEQLMDGLAK